MRKAAKKSRARDDPTGNPYDELCGRTLSEAEEAEINFNLVNFVETLIEMDRQHQAWLKNQKTNQKK
jgi:hypothetical protein